MNPSLGAVALAAAALGAYADLRTRRIPNALTYGALVAALLAQALLGGARGLAAGGAGALVGGAPLFLFFLLGGIGAGDVKLMAAVGAWLGPGLALWALLDTALAGAALALAAVFFHRRFADTASNLGGLVTGRRRDLNLESAGAIRIPYGLAIAMGTLAIWLAR